MAEEYDPIASDADEAFEEITLGVTVPMTRTPTTLFTQDLHPQVLNAIKFSSSEKACLCVVKTDAHGRGIVEICDWHDGFRAALLAYTEGLIR